MTVLRQLLLIIIIGVDVAWRVVAVGLVVDEGGCCQTVGERRLFRRPANGEGGHGHHELRQLECVDDHLGHVDSGAEVAVAKSFLIHQITECLGIEQGIGGGIDEGKEIVVAGLCLAVAGPLAGAVEVGADGQHYWGFLHHRLVEVGRGQFGFHLWVAGDHNGIELQVSHGLRTGGLRHQTVKQFFADDTVSILADGSSGQNMFHICVIFVAKLRIILKNLYLCSQKVNIMEVNMQKEVIQKIAHEMAEAGKSVDNEMPESQIAGLLERCLQAVSPQDAQQLLTLANQTLVTYQKNLRPEVTEVRPQSLECDVVRFQNNKEKWVALVGLLDGYPYEIFTGLQDDEEGIILPKTVTHGKIIKQVNPDGTKRYDFQFENKRGYKTTVEGLSEKFNPEYWNYAKLISGVLRYRMPLEHVIRLVASLSLKDESINTWKVGVERALKKYIPGVHDDLEGTDVDE